MGTTVEFEQKLASFLSGVQAKIDLHYQTQLPNLVAIGHTEVVMVERGQRYVRVIRKGPGTHSAYCFIDTKAESMGAVLKPAGYKAPAKHARGNIFADDNGLNCAGVYSVAYLR